MTEDGLGYCRACGKALTGRQRVACCDAHRLLAWAAPRVRKPHRRTRSRTFEVVSLDELAWHGGARYVQPNVRRIENALARGEHVPGVRRLNPSSSEASAQDEAELPRAAPRVPEPAGT